MGPKSAEQHKVFSFFSSIWIAMFAKSNMTLKTWNGNVIALFFYWKSTRWGINSGPLSRK